MGVQNARFLSAQAAPGGASCLSSAYFNILRLRNIVVNLCAFGFDIRVSFNVLRLCRLMVLVVVGSGTFLDFQVLRNVSGNCGE